MSAVLEKGTVVCSCTVTSRLTGSLNSTIYQADFDPAVAEKRLKNEFRAAQDVESRELLKRRIRMAKEFSPAVTFLKQFNDPGYKCEWLDDFAQYQDEIYNTVNSIPGSESLYCREYDAFICRDKGKRAYYQALEYFPKNETLTDLLAKGSLDQKQLLTYARKMLYALEQLHLHRIVHSDLKPDNLLIIQNKPGNGPATELRLIDFDSSLIMGKSTPREKAFLRLHPHEKYSHRGTPRYMSPEHFTKATPNPASDVFTAAIILCEMLSPDGHPFPAGKEEYKKAVKDGKADFTRLKCKVPAEVIETIRAGLEYQAVNRPTLAKLREALNLLR